MSLRKTKDIRAALVGKGFDEDKTHHHIYWLHVGGKKSGIRTRISHGKSEYGDNLLGPMATQLKLRRAQLNELIDCDLDADGYLDILREKGEL